ncbi:DUF2510 domain-containing protein [Nocardioides sp. JQ2195]|uniref:DUF2510 domain-containing protein n=1 Tax=Nocardioides sp. JQ2195 TaxID=2592334 RepID=UPI00143EC5AF|nr:DUF2510 domain-containing protein [Nocardioides sp. JQ2195]QIX28223.1 DUF2510 domain-containing protein [Nocardioides sp. JQ2195]
MSQPAWYPDPSGQPGSFRYWDGQSWSAETTANPYDAPPASVQPSGPPAQPQGQPYGEQPTQQFPQQPHDPQQGWAQQQGQPYGQQPAHQWSPMPAPNGGPGGSGKKGVLVAVAAVVVVLLLVGGGIAAWLTMGDDDSDDKSADDESSQSSEPTDEASSATSEPTDESTSSTDALTDCPQALPAVHAPTPPGTIKSFDLSAPVPAGYTADEQADQAAEAFAWLRDPRGAYEIVEQSGDAGWISLLVVGSVERSDGYGSLEAAAQSVTNCMAGSEDMYTGMAGTTPKGSEQITVDGHNAWRIDTEIRVDDPRVTVEGDHAIVVAVEVDDSETYAIFAGVVPLGDQKLLDQLEKVVAGMTVA